MTVESITGENFAGLQKFSINLNPRITYLCGPNGAGKSTIAKTAFFFGLEGIAEKGTHYKGRGSFVGQWGDEAKTVIKLRDDKGTYTVTRAMNDQKQTQFSVVADDGRKLDQKWLDGLFKSLMISPMDFAMLKPKEQAMELGIDTSEFDEKILAKKLEFALINRELSNFGEIVIPRPCERVDISELNRQKNEAIEFNMEQQYRSSNIQAKKARIADLDAQIADLQQKLQIALVTRENRQHEYVALPRPEPLKDTTGFDKVMAELDAQNQEAYAYEQALEKSRQKEAKKKELAANKAAQAQLQEEKTSYLQSLDLPFNTMTIDDDGGLLMDGNPLCEPYKSSGELWAIIPRIIAKLNPSLRYLFIQGWNMMDKKKQANLVNDLLELGFQLCIEVVDETEDGGVIVLTELNK
jgi:AAA domain